MKLNRRIKPTVIILLFLFSLSCKKSETGTDNILLRVGDKELREEDIIEKIPTGLNPLDSARLFQALTEEWVSNHLLSDFAEERLGNIDEIEKKVEDYRNQLIVQEYLNQMTESRTKKIEDKEIREYYDLHKKELLTELPLIKGVFIKVNKSTGGREEIKRLLTEDKEGNIDLLEQNWLDVCLAYDYFKDKWIDWETISGLIPFRFGDADKFLENRSYFETEYGDYAYYLLISDYLPGGSEQPFEYASIWISGLLDQKSKEKYKEELIENLLKKGIKEHRLEPVSYNPLTHEKEESSKL